MLDVLACLALTVWSIYGCFLIAGARTRLEVDRLELQEKRANAEYLWAQSNSGPPSLYRGD